MHVTVLLSLVLIVLSGCAKGPVEDLDWAYGTWVEDTELTEAGVRKNEWNLPEERLESLVGMLVQQRDPMTLDEGTLTLRNGEQQKTFPVTVVTNTPTLLILAADNGFTMTLGRDETGTYRTGGGFVTVNGERKAIEARIYLKPTAGP